MSSLKQQLPFLRLRTSLVLHLREIRAYVAGLKNAGESERKKKVLIYGQGRSGTTLFEHLMCSTGHFVGYHEVLNTVTREVVWPIHYIRGLGRQFDDENIILHVKPNHLGQDRKRPVNVRLFLKAMYEDGWFIVHIQRKNIIMKMISNYLAVARGGYHKTDDKEEKHVLRIPPQEFFDRYDNHCLLLDEENTLLQGLPHIKISYERDLERTVCHQQTIDKVLEELGLEKRTVSTKLKKINNTSPEKLVENLDELHKGFLARGWEWTL